MNCPHCGNAVSDDARFCNTCGADIALSGLDPVCPSCGMAQSPGARFCNNCGAAIEDGLSNQAVEKSKICSNCGGALSEGAVFCSACGASVGGSSAATSFAGQTSAASPAATAVFPAQPSPSPRQHDRRQAYAPQPVMQQAYSYQQVDPNKGMGASVAGLVLGVLALVGWFIDTQTHYFGFGVIGIKIFILMMCGLLAILGTIFSSVGLGRARGAKKILGGIGLIASIAALVISVVIFVQWANF